MKINKIDVSIFMLMNEAIVDRKLSLEKHGEYSLVYAKAHARYCALWNVIEETGLTHEYLIYLGKNPSDYGY